MLPGAVLPALLVPHAHAPGTAAYPRLCTTGCAGPAAHVPRSESLCAFHNACRAAFAMDSSKVPCSMFRRPISVLFNNACRAAFAMDSSKVLVLDIRYPTLPVAQLQRHQVRVPGCGTAADLLHPWRSFSGSGRAEVVLLPLCDPAAVVWCWQLAWLVAQISMHAHWQQAGTQTCSPLTMLSVTWRTHSALPGATRPCRQT